MTFRTLIRRSLRFHWRAHLGVVLGAAIGSAALIGALVVGDSVRESLREMAVRRLGNIYFAMSPGDRLFRSQLAEDFYGLFTRLYPDLHEGSFAAALQLSSTAVSGDGAARANRVNLIGVDERWLKMGGDPRFANIPAGGVLLNEALAKHLNATTGDTVLLRVTKPTSLSQEAPITPRSDQIIAQRAQVTGIVTSAALGDFNLLAGHGAPFNAFIGLRTLQGMAVATNKANLLLSSKWEVDLPRPLTRIERIARFLRAPKETIGVKATNGTYEAIVNREPLLLDMLNAPHHMQRVWRLADVELNLRTPGTDIELSSRRIFLDPAVKDAVKPDPERAGKETARRIALNQEEKAAEIVLAELLCANGRQVLTYLVNLLRFGTNTTPYSMVTAAGAPWTPAGMRDDEIIVTQWLAEDLQVKPGDEMSLVYFEAESGARLIERTNTFRVRAIVPMEMPWADRTLMPEFPGIEKAESTSDWDAGFSLVHKIRDKDEEYWKQHRGTPKAFVTLAAGQKMWANRFGDLTAIRFPIPTNTVGTRSTASHTSAKDGDAVERVPTDVESFRAALEKKILANLKPEELGLRFEPVREQALKAAEQSQDFGGLFLGFSFFLIVAALLLMAMLFQFGLEQRTAEIGTLLALGFTPRQVRRLLLGEGVALAFIGGVLGALGGLGYARAMLHGLATIWRDAVGASALNFHATTQTLAVGLSAATVVGAITIRLALRKFARRSARELLAGEVQSPESGVRSRGRLIGSLALAGAFGLVGYSLVLGDTANAGVFFGAGALVLIAGLSLVSAWLANLTNVLPASCRQFNSVQRDSNSEGTLDLPAGCRKHVTFSSLAMNGCARRRTRSLATIAMLACGSFLIVSIGVFRLDANRDASKRTSGTGGFALIGETTMPVVHDLNSQAGRDFFALSARDLEGVSFVPFRVREGDEASCLNLNRAQKPRLLGVKPESLETRFTFAKGEAWRALKSEIRPVLRSNTAEGGNPKSEIEVPAIGDANSIQWSMGKKVGDTIDYVDERGQRFKVRIVAAVASSILQGQLIIDEAEFVKRFPGESGYRMFLIDAPSYRVAEVSASLSRAMQDVGLELTPTAQRLAQFNAVQNTYLGTFQVLGGLGLLLGSVGLGIVVLRNVLERRGELALLMAVGFRKPTLQGLLLIENGALLALGLALGVAAAAVAVLPALLSPAAQLPYASLAGTLAAVLINGALWTWAATRFALRGNLLAALRNE